MGGIGNCCCDVSCVAACPTHAARSSYNAVVGSHSATLISPDSDCNFIGSSCIVDSPTVTNSWTVDYGSFSFSDTFTCLCETLDCCNGSQQPGSERDPATREFIQTGYEQKDKWIRWEQRRETLTVQIYDVGSGNLRILVTVLKELVYLVGVNTVVRGGYRVATFTLCTPHYEDDFVTLPEIPCSISYGSPIWDSWPSFPDPSYPPCNEAPSTPGCQFAISEATTTVTTLELESIGPFNNALCVASSCVIGTYSTQKVKSRLYTQNCAGGFPTAGIFVHDCFGVFDRPNYGAYGFYYYYSDPFPCDAFPSNPIPLKREPYTDIAATTEYETVCGQPFPYSTPAVSKDLSITIT